MSRVYLIKPLHKKSIVYHVEMYRENADGSISWFNIDETYRWGQGFVEDTIDLPYSDDKEHSVDPQIGWGCELEDLCAVDFEFDDSFTEEEKEEIEQLWADGGAGWLYDGDHNWEVEEDTITILGPFVVDKINEEVYNESLETIELKPRPPFVATTAWPFSG